MDSKQTSLPPKVASLLKSFPTVLTLDVLWGDMDANQHVNNTKYLSYTETARVQYLETIRSQRDDPAMATIIPMVKENVIKYKFPVTYPDTVSVGVRVDPKSIKPDRFDFICLIVSQKHNIVVCDVRTHIVAFDLSTNRKANMSDEFLKGLEQWERRVDSGWELVVEENAQL
ncbi:Thioesterase/thiol ester dehydrase-isomerase [Rhizoclosmatium globosum]|uniref:Thioesterase/thiol ester dehydrase-isomerase n=1 Tax=Rhizoclosmatium globosum TaxID=329046 RepID=A0A1Y2C544_9FUNG|nr:Thioesterase/thiol ester dehydrase-isomerase [Rhizoclosmatium globosum]|eukprot:ORY42149.1 Thioesterase/thiol ester dehydrase-isomerase [Rhizoclosmatium globosum]